MPPFIPTRRRAAAPLAALLLAGAALAPASARETFALPPPPDVSGSVSGNYLSALVAGADRDTQAASAYFREVLRSDPRNPELLERTFVASLSNGNVDDALDFARRLVKADARNGLAHLVLGVGQLRDGHWVAARREFASGGAGSEHDVTATLLTAWSYAGQGDERQSLAAIDSLKDSGFQVFRDYHAALMADLANDLPEATKRFKTAYAEDHTILRLVDAYARFEARHGAKDEALRALDAFGQVLPHHPQIEALEADIAAGRPIAPLVKTAQEGAAEVLYGLGAAGGRQGDELAAIVYLRLSLYLSPNNGLAEITLADLYARLKQNEQALAVYSRVPDTSALRGNADVQTGLTLDAMGKPGDAVRYLQDLVSRHPKDVDALTTLGNIEREQKDYSGAITAYTGAVDALPKGDKSAWTLFYFRGISYERNKQWPKAEADFEHALEIEPDQPLVLNYLGYSWVDRGEHLDQAFDMLRKAVALRPEDGFIVDSLGWADYKLGDYEGAVKELEKAIALKPGDPTINDHLGDAYWRAGRRLEGKFQWQHAKDLNPEPDDLAQINAKLKDGLPEIEKPTATAESVPAPVAAPHNAENPELPKGAPQPHEAPGAADKAKKSGG